MYAIDEKDQSLLKARRKLIPSLIFNLILPWILYMLLHYFFRNDTASLAITAAIPAVRTAIILIWRRRIDWIGVLGAIGFVSALSVSILLKGNPLPIKLYHPIVTGLIGLVFLISVIIKRPIIMIIVRNVKHKEGIRLNNQVIYKKLTILTLLFGFIFLVDAAIHIIMALTLSTTAFLSLSKVVTWVIILCLIISRKWIGRKN